MKFWVPSLASLSGLRIQRCCQLPYSSKMQLGSGIAVAGARASSCSSDVTPGLGISICCGCGPKKTKKKKKKAKETNKKKKKVLYIELPVFTLTCGCTARRHKWHSHFRATRFISPIHSKPECREDAETGGKARVYSQGSQAWRWENKSHIHLRGGEGWGWLWDEEAGWSLAWGKVIAGREKAR